MTTIDLVLPIKTVSQPNRQEHWSKKYKRDKQQKLSIWANFVNRYQFPLPCLITLINLSPRTRDFDNNVISFKAIRDALAEIVLKAHGIEYNTKGYHDSDPRVKFAYSQEKAPKKAIRIIISPTTENP